MLIIVVVASECLVSGAMGHDYSSVVRQWSHIEELATLSAFFLHINLVILFSLAVPLFCSMIEIFDGDAVVMDTASKFSLLPLCFNDRNHEGDAVVMDTASL